MRINAIYFTDKDVTHVKLNDTKSCNNYGYFHHLLINGLPVYSDTYGCDDYILKGRLESVKAVHYKEVLSHYEHKQTGEQKSEFEYREYIKSLKDENGDYKDLESEYLCRKFESVYIPVYNKIFHEEDCAIFWQEEHPYQVDEYCVCSGLLEKSDVSNNWSPKFFLYKFDKWNFANDIVSKIMREYGISPSSKLKSGEYYSLFPKGDYKWLEFCGDEYFIRSDDMSFKKDEYIYGSFEDVIAEEKAIKNMIESRVRRKLDDMRTAVVRRSKIAELSTELDKLRDAFKRGEQKGLINIKIDNIKSLVSDLTNNKIRL